MGPPAAPSFARRLQETPVGVALLAKLEGRFRRDGTPWFRGPRGIRPEAVAAAVEAVGTMTLGALLALALEGADDLAGPWRSEAAVELPEAFRCAAGRAPIAEAVARRFASWLPAPLDRAAQQWWCQAGPAGWNPADHVCFRDFSAVYNVGEFPWAGLWTVSDPPPETHDGLLGAWELDFGPVTRWRLPVSPEARICELHGPEDWAALVERFPRPAARRHEGWELPGPNQRPADIEGLLAGGWRQAARNRITAHRAPDWGAVARAFDGVHLSWAGFLTAEGYVSDLADGAVTMLRYWRSERTLWLADVFGAPEPLPAPTLSGDYCQVTGVDAATDPERVDSDRRELLTLLGRT